MGYENVDKIIVDQYFDSPIQAKFDVSEKYIHVYPNEAWRMGHLQDDLFEISEEHLKPLGYFVKRSEMLTLNFDGQNLL